MNLTNQPISFHFSCWLSQEVWSWHSRRVFGWRVHGLPTQSQLRLANIHRRNQVGQLLGGYGSYDFHHRKTEIPTPPQRCPYSPQPTPQQCWPREVLLRSEEDTNWPEGQPFEKPISLFAFQKRSHVWTMIDKKIISKGIARSISVSISAFVCCFQEKRSRRFKESTVRGFKWSNTGNRIRKNNNG